MAIRELYESQEIVADAYGTTGTRIFISDWDERFYVAPRIGDIYSQQFPGLFCSGLKFTPYGRPRPDHTYDFSRIEVTYSTVTRVYRGEITWSWQTSVEVLNTANMRHWSDNSVNEDQTFASLYPMMELTGEYLADPRTVNEAVFLNTVGHVNSDLFHGCAPGTLLFEGADVRIDRVEFDMLGALIIIKFLYRPRGHNWVWRENKQPPDWDYFLEPLYPAAEFRPLAIIV